MINRGSRVRKANIGLHIRTLECRMQLLGPVQLLRKGLGVL